MILEINVNGQKEMIDIDKLAAECSNIINIGKATKQVWNAIAIDDESIDQFQCNLIGAAGSYKLNHGQERTECPKGLMSNKLIPCNGCMGRCVNIRAGRPKYYQRNPDSPTLLNGNVVSQYGDAIKVGDVITIGNVVMYVREEN